MNKLEKKEEKSFKEKMLEHVKDDPLLRPLRLKQSPAKALKDPGFCGLGIETGKHDPFWETACKPHDEAFNEVKAGGKRDSLAVNGGFAINAIKAAGIQVGKAIWAVTGLVPYIVLGTFGGFARFRWIMPRPKQDPDSGEMH